MTIQKKNSFTVQMKMRRPLRCHIKGKRSRAWEKRFLKKRNKSLRSSNDYSQKNSHQLLQVTVKILGELTERGHMVEEPEPGLFNRKRVLLQNRHSYAGESSRSTPQPILSVAPLRSLPPLDPIIGASFTSMDMFRIAIHENQPHNQITFFLKNLTKPDIRQNPFSLKI
ncbi:hypothetical protein LguiA_013922 [Lonicera macranthoides]